MPRRVYLKKSTGFKCTSNAVKVALEPNLLNCQFVWNCNLYVKSL